MLLVFMLLPTANNMMQSTVEMVMRMDRGMRFGTAKQKLT